MNVKNLVLGVGIFIVYLLMLNYGIEAFYKSPQYDDFCKTGDYRFYGKVYPGTLEQNCSYSSELNNAERMCYDNGGNPIFDYDSKGCAVSIKECDMCSKELSKAVIDHDKIVFLIAIIVGIITLFVGYLVLSTEPVGSALMASGVGAIFYGSARNWSNLSSIWRFLLLLVALVLLVWIALRLNKNLKGKK